MLPDDPTHLPERHAGPSSLSPAALSLLAAPSYHHAQQQPRPTTTTVARPPKHHTPLALRSPFSNNSRRVVGQLVDTLPSVRVEGRSPRRPQCSQRVPAPRDGESGRHQRCDESCHVPTERRGRHRRIHWKRQQFGRWDARATRGAGSFGHEQPRQHPDQRAQSCRQRTSNFVDAGTD
jgi:hypothetical protein